MGVVSSWLVQRGTGMELAAFYMVVQQAQRLRQGEELVSPAAQQLVEVPSSSEDGGLLPSEEKHVGLCTLLFACMAPLCSLLFALNQHRVVSGPLVVVPS